LKRILNNPDMPVQIIIAGKAHPKDVPGKSFIRDIWLMSRDSELFRRLVFIEDYSLKVARELVQGVDLWLNTPKRGEEACGTSGMKAAVNGTLNLSVLDGWYDEAFEESGGWAIGDRTPYSEDQDDLHASGIYSTLENEIVPMYYQERERGGPPEEWVKRMKTCLINMSTRFSSNRMVAEYDSALYKPAHAGYAQMSSNNFASARTYDGWMKGVRQAWPQVRVVETGPKLDTPVLAGKSVDLSASIQLGGLKPEDVRVEALIGHVNGDGYLEGSSVVELAPSGERGGAYSFSSSYLPSHTGRVGVSVRVVPKGSSGLVHSPLTYGCHPLLRWS
jgi:starch phosphorylase